MTTQILFRTADIARSTQNIVEVTNLTNGQILEGYFLTDNEDSRKTVAFTGYGECLEVTCRFDTEQGFGWGFDGPASSI